MIQDWKLDEIYCTVKRKIEDLEAEKKNTTNEKRLGKIEDEIARIRWSLNTCLI